jgi:hypothetical protein
MYQPLSNAQAKAVIDAEQVYSALRDAQQEGESVRGGMHWKSIAGRDYLYRTLGKTNKSLGPRNEKTEAMQRDFLERKERVEERVATLADKVKTLSRVNAVYRVGHVPNEVADICIALDDAGLLDTNITIIGTNAMHAYAAMAGVRFPDEIMATVDMDLLWNNKSKLNVATTKAVEEGGLLGILKRADRTYEIKPGQAFRAQNNSGYMVDLIRQMPDPPWALEPDRFFNQDLVATDIWNMKWMLGAPRQVQTAIALDGRPFRLAAPDPRAFAMFKLWLGTECPDREPLKRNRDIAQADAVITLIQDRLPHLAESWPQLKSFPKEVVAKAAARAQRMRG